MKKTKVIDLENHFIAPSLVELVKKRGKPPIYHPDGNVIQMLDLSESCVPVHSNLTDLSLRIPVFDEYGIDMAVVSGAPIVEYLDDSDGPEGARIANNELCEQVAKNPDRFRGFASLYTNNPDEAVKELERCKNELGFVGWLAFSNNGRVGIDDDSIFPILECAESLNMPVYVHPAFSQYERLYGCGTGIAAGGMGFTIDASISIARLVMKGVFDKLPKLQIMGSHLCEALPFYLGRLDSRTRPGPGMKVGKNEHEPSYYFKNNIWATTAGNYTPAAFDCTREVLGIDRILYSSDFPFVAITESEEIMEQISLTEIERRALYSENSAKLLNL